MFRRSIIDYVHRRGIVDSPFVTEAALDEAWNVRGGWVEYLWQTAAENWLAIDADGRAIGWAMSIERGPGIREPDPKARLTLCPRDEPTSSCR